MSVSFLPALCLLLVTLYSCNKPDDISPDPIPGGLLPFTARVVERVPVSAIIEWTESVNVGSESAKYKVYLENALVHSGLLQLKDTLYGLSGSVQYNGRVVAYTLSGDSAVATFILEKTDGFILFGREDLLTSNNVIHSLNINTGSLLWKAPWGTSGSFSVPGWTAPTISNDTVFISNYQSSQQSLQAFNLNSGANIWKVLPYSGGWNTFITSDITYYQGKLYATARNGVVCINAATGQIIWRTANIGTNEFRSTPVIFDDKIVVNAVTNTGTGDLCVLNLSNGSVVWHFAHDGGIYGRPLINGNSIFFTTTASSAYGVNKTTGTQLWRKTYVGPNNLYFAMTAPIVYNNIIIFGTSEDGFFGVNPATGATIWNYYNGFDGGTQPAFGNGLIYFSQSFGSTTYQTMITAVNPMTGFKVWEKVNTNQYSSNIIFAQNKLYMKHYYTISVTDANSGNLLLSGLYNGEDFGPFTVSLNGTTYYNSAHGNYKQPN